MIPFCDLAAQYSALKQEIDAGIAAVLAHQCFILGPEVGEMERRLAAYAGVRHCISVASGTEALLMSLMALGIGPGDEVIVPAFTFAAAAEMVVLVGATPVLVDIEPDTCNIDAALVEAAVTDATRAIIPVGLYGQAADMVAVNDIAERNRLVVIEDAAQSFGADFHNRKSCGLSTIGCTSFFPSKPLGCYGDGGAIFTDDGELAEALWQIRIHGQDGRYNHVRIGVGGRMDTLQCAIILAKLTRFEWELERRIEIGCRYNRLFDERGIERVVQRENRSSVFAQYTIFADDRERIRAALGAAGIPTAVHYPVSLNNQPAYRERARFGPLPNSEWAAGHVLNLPMHAYLDESTQERIADMVASAVRDAV